MKKFKITGFETHDGGLEKILEFFKSKENSKGYQDKPFFHLKEAKKIRNNFYSLTIVSTCPDSPGKNIAFKKLTKYLNEIYWTSYD